MTTRHASWGHARAVATPPWRPLSLSLSSCVLRSGLAVGWANRAQATRRPQPSPLRPSTWRGPVQPPAHVIHPAGASTRRARPLALSPTRGTGQLGADSRPQRPCASLVRRRECMHNLRHNLRPRDALGSGTHIPVASTARLNLASRVHLASASSAPLIAPRTPSAHQPGSTPTVGECVSGGMRKGTELEMWGDVGRCGEMWGGDRRVAAWARTRLVASSPQSTKLKPSPPVAPLAAASPPRHRVMELMRRWARARKSSRAHAVCPAVVAGLSVSVATDGPTGQPSRRSAFRRPRWAPVDVSHVQPRERQSSNGELRRGVTRDGGYGRSDRYIRHGRFLLRLGLRLRRPRNLSIFERRRLRPRGGRVGHEGDEWMQGDGTVWLNCGGRHRLRDRHAHDITVRQGHGRRSEKIMEGGQARSWKEVREGHGRRRDGEIAHLRDHGRYPGAQATRL